MSDLLHNFIDIFLHLDTHLDAWAGSMGPWLYVLLFVIIFCETGLVVTPFLPGDSLLFAVGALAATGTAINVLIVGVSLCVAAIIGDALNYYIGSRVGPKVFTSETNRWLNKHHLLRAQGFYEKHGGKTIIFARFMPIIRTFAPFVAGIGKMSYPRFASFNVVGAILWIWSFLIAGFYFGGQPFVKKNFQLVIFAIIIISALPAIFEFFRARRDAKNTP